MKKNKLVKIFLYLILLAFAISIIVPVGWVFMSSIKENVEFYGNPWTLPKGFYFQNFINAIQKAKMGEYFFNSVIVTGLALVILLTVSIPAAYILARFEFKSKKTINRLMTAGLFINVNYIVVPIFLMILGWDKHLRDLIGNGFFINNLFVLALVYAANAIPFTTFLLSNFFRTLSQTYQEAAAIDGASHFRTMTDIMIPMAMPSIITVVLFNFLSFWNEYIIALTLMPGDKKTLPVGLVSLMQAQRAAPDYGRLYAGLVLVMLPTLLLYILVQRKLTEGMTVGGIKG